MSFSAAPFSNWDILITSGLGWGPNPGIHIPDDSDFWLLSDKKKLELLYEFKGIFKEYYALQIYLEGGIQFVSDDRFKLILNSKFASDEVKKKLIADKAQDGFIIHDPLEDRSVKGELRKKIIERDKSECRYCGKLLTETEIQIDHIHPYSKGGKSEENNLAVACKSCNNKKKNKLLADSEMELRSLV